MLTVEFFDEARERARRYVETVVAPIDENEGCWADVWDNQVYQACGAEPDPDSAVGLCPTHRAKLGGL